LRQAIPRLGLREYWYPALPASKVGRKPVYWVMLGDEMVFFRDEQGAVAALSDVCPHRGASLSDPDNSHFRGFISCPYHGATFDGSGQCRAFLTEGPDSKMVGKLRARAYPTRTIKGWVFVWMGAGEPAPIEEDVPPEFFTDELDIFASYTYWQTNWLLALENHSDAHNCFYVHRNCLNILIGLSGGRNRTPVGPKSEIVNGGLRAIYDNQDYYADENGRVPYQMYYPGIDAYWPKHRWRLLWAPLVQRFKKKGKPKHHGSAEWQLGHHLPSLVRTGGGNTRYAVPVKPNLARIVHFYFPPRRTGLARLWQWLYYALIYNPLHYNFSAADDGAASQCRYWVPEQLSSTDSQVVVLRQMVVQRSRDAVRAREQENGIARKPLEDSGGPPTLQPAPVAEQELVPSPLAGEG
jgi:phenylpropionate dioxygenase-like ring-hydroxylating dioxygenase large terminal subunit